MKPLLPRSLRPAHYIFATVFLLRLVVLARLTASPFLLPTHGDMHFYDEWAQRILKGHLTDHLAFYGLPLYPYLLALIYKLVGYGPFVPGLLQAGLDAGTATILYNLGARVFTLGEVATGPATRARPRLDASQFIGAGGALGWALFAPAQAYAVILMPTICFVFMFWLIVWLIVRKNSSPTPRECLFFGFLIGFTAMGVAMILFLIPFILAAVVLKARTDNHHGTQPVDAPTRCRLILPGLLLFIGVVAGTSPCWIHNYFVARDPVFLSAHSGVNFWVGNNPLATGYPRFPPGLHAGQETMLKDSINTAEKAAGHRLKRSEISRYWSAKAKEYIHGHFVDWLKLLGTKATNFWNAFQYDDLSIITSLREDGVIFPVLGFGIVAALGLPGMLLTWRRFPGSRWMTAAIGLQMLALLPVFVTERYRLAAVPGLLLFAASGLSIFWQSCVSVQLRSIAMYLALLIGSAIFVAWPQRDAALWALDAYNSGWRALESRNLAVAEQKLALAYSYVPDNAETNFALGNLRLAQNKKAAAKSFYFATLRLDHDHPGAYNNLGILALEENRWQLAARFFGKASKQDPDDAKIYYLLAQAHLQAGEIDSARTEIALALKLDPAQAEFRQLRTRIEQSELARKP